MTAPSELFVESELLHILEERYKQIKGEFYIECPPEWKDKYDEWPASGTASLFSVYDDSYAGYVEWTMRYDITHSTYSVSSLFVSLVPTIDCASCNPCKSCSLRDSCHCDPHRCKFEVCVGCGLVEGEHTWESKEDK